MTKHEVELRQYEAITIGRRRFKVAATQRQILVDGEFVGYVSETPNCGLVLVSEIPQEIVEAARQAVTEFWGQEVETISQALPMDEEEVEPDEE